jgi:hypothetical protein
LFADILESRSLLAITYNVVVGGTLDINPISSIFPSTAFSAVEINLTTVPGTTNGVISKVQGGVTEIPWGSGAPNTFAPGAGNNRIFGGEGFRYKSTGTVAGVSDSIPIRFRDSTGFNTQTDTLIVNVVSPAGAPQITTQPQGLISAPTGSTATMSVVATGNPTLTYQWFSGISPNAQFPISGATSSTYTTPALTNTGSDRYYWVRVSNGVGSVASTTTTVKVGAAPTANAGGPYSAVEGGTVQLTGSGTDPNNGLYVAYEWDLDNDGLFNESGAGADNGNENVQNPVFQAKDGPAAYPIKLRTTNDRGLSTVANGTVNITNVAPSNLTPSIASGASQGTSFSVSGSFADPGTLDTHVVTINWGDGSANTVLNLAAGVTTFSTTKTYAVSYTDTSNYTVTFTVADKDGASVSTTRPFAVTRNNQLIVTTATDTDDGTADPAFGGGTSLREALRYAEAKAGADTVNFATALGTTTLNLSQGWSGSGDDTALRIFGDLTLEGDNRVTLAIPSGTQRRLVLAGGGTLTVRNLTMRDGNLLNVQDGGAIWINNGALVVQNVRFINNRGNNGGAIRMLSGATATITNGQFDSNSARDLGGAMYNDGGLTISGSTFTTNSGGEAGALQSVGTLTIDNSTFTGNASNFNGGALRLYGTATIRGSTFNANTVVNQGGALISFGSLTVSNSTFADNGKDAVLLWQGSADLAHVTVAYNRNGGLRNVGSTTVMRSSIVAANTGGDLLENPLASGSTGNFVNATAAVAKLGTLANNGGPTQTILPLFNSPAIDGGVAIGGIFADQRGLTRAMFEAPDAGAVEANRTDLNLPTVTTGGSNWFLGPTVLPNGDRRVYRELIGGLTGWADGGTAVRIALSINGTVVVQNSGGGVYTRTGSPVGPGTAWQLMTSITGNNGQTWLLGPELNGATNDRFIYRWPTAGQLTSAGGAGTTLQNYNGVIWTKTTNGQNWRYISDGNWQAVSAPGILTATFDAVARQAVTLLLTDEGRPFYTRTDITIRNQTTNQPITAGTIAWNASGTQATIDLTNQLPDGNYAVQVGATTFGSFFVLKGDFNRDRTVNFDDLLVLAANYNTSGANNAQGDVNYDGNVNFDDLLAMAANYNTSLPAAGTPAGIVVPPSAPSNTDGGDDSDNAPASVL